jgi:hypothetical protein
MVIITFTDGTSIVTNEVTIKSGAIHYDDTAVSLENVEQLETENNILTVT